MDGLTLSTITNAANNSSAIHFFSNFKKSRFLSPVCTRKPRKVLVFASKDEPKFDQWDQMELKFGRMLGEDPKITLAKIIGWKSNPDMSYLEIEKLIEKKGSKANEIEEVQFDLSKGNDTRNSACGLNLIRPVPKKGVKFESNANPVESNKMNIKEPVVKAPEKSKTSVPNVILRKPTSFNDDDAGNGKSSRFGMKPSLSLKMGKEQREDRFSDITLLKKPEPMQIDLDEESGNSVDTRNGLVDEIGEMSLEDGSATTGMADEITLLRKPEQTNVSTNSGEDESSRASSKWSSSPGLLNVAGSNGNDLPETRKEDSGIFTRSSTELQADTSSGGEAFSSCSPSQANTAEITPEMAIDTMLIGKPKRLGSSINARQSLSGEGIVPSNPESFSSSSELEKFLTSSPIQEHEDSDWASAEELVKTGGRGEVELISSSTRGFVVSFGSLVGFLPYRNLGARWKFLAFESWLRKKGLDPSMYRQNLGIVGRDESSSTATSPKPMVDSTFDHKTEGQISSEMKLEELLMIYDQEKLKFLSSFVGQKVKASVVLADRKSRRLIFSIKPKEKEDLVEKKRSLMAKLSVGDVVKCCIKKITYFGIFVEFEGVPALIHQTEVSWDATLDPASYFKVGQFVEAKVHQLDFSLERIFLSLKEITPDPLMEALEAVVGGHDSLGVGLEAAQGDMEWADVESLIKELQQFDGIQSVSKGRYFLSPGLAPTFQVYMASMFEDQYKLLARAGNRVQEVIVQTSLSKEELKYAILTCTNRV